MSLYPFILLWKKPLGNKYLLNKFIERLALPSKITISLPENDQRILDASVILKDIGLNIVGSNDIEIAGGDYLLFLKKLKFSSNWPEEKLAEYIGNPFIKALCMLKDDRVDGIVSGCTIPTSDVLRGALRIIGLKSSSKWLSSMFLMVDQKSDNAITFADCAVIPEPNSEQLVEIAFEAAQMHKNITGDEAAIAFLSFSTKGSAKHYRVKVVQDAVKIFQKRNHGFLHEGEIQLDAALDIDISNKKINNSILKGNANTLIFPNLDAGNVAYKLMQRFASHYACGPLLLGLNKSVNDLSRGASVQDIVLISLITALQIEKNRDANL